MPAFDAHQGRDLAGGVNAPDVGGGARQFQLAPVLLDLLEHGADLGQAPRQEVRREARRHVDGEELGAQAAFPHARQIEVAFAGPRPQVQAFIQ